MAPGTDIDKAWNEHKAYFVGKTEADYGIGKGKGKKEESKRGGKNGGWLNILYYYNSSNQNNL